MSRWDEEFNNHPLHETVRKSLELIDHDIEAADDTLFSENFRLKRALGFLQKTLESLDPEIAPISILNSIEAHLKHQNFWNQLNSYVSNPSAQYLATANNHLNAQLGAIYQLAGRTRPKSSAEVESEMREVFEKYSAAVSTQLKDYSQELADRGTDLETMLQRQQALDKRLDEIEETQNTRLNEWQKQFADTQALNATTFSDSQIEQKNEFLNSHRELVADGEKKTEAEIELWSKKLKDFFGTFSGEIEDYRKDSKKLHKSIRDLYELTAEDSVAGGYKALADHEQREANNWRKYAICFIVVTGLWLFSWTIGKYALDWYLAREPANYWLHLSTVVPLTVVLLFGAVYASKQSALHRNNEKRTRWFALEVKAFDPFISSLSEEQRTELKKAFTARLFGHDQTDGEETSTIVDANTFKLFSQLIKDVSSVIKK